MKKYKFGNLPTFEEFLFENPDTAKFGLKRNLFFDDDDAYPFGEFKGVMYIHKKPRTTHYELGDEIIPFKLWDNGRVPDRYNMKNCGRLWTSEKLISFWNLETEFDDKIIAKLNKAIKESRLKFKVDASWYVEVMDIDNYFKSEIMNVETAISKSSSAGNKYKLSWNYLE